MTVELEVELDKLVKKKIKQIESEVLKVVEKELNAYGLDNPRLYTDFELMQPSVVEDAIKHHLIANLTSHLKPSRRTSTKAKAEVQE